METLRRPYTADEHAQLISAQARQAGKELDARRIGYEIALRQWCVEQAVAVVGTPPMMVATPAPLSPLSDEALAKSLRHYEPHIVDKPETAVVFVAREILQFVQSPIDTAEGK